VSKPKPKEVKEIVDEIFRNEDGVNEPDSIKGPWLLDEYKRSMLYIFDVRNNEDKLVARFVADEETKDDLRAIPKLISRAPAMRNLLEGVLQDIQMANAVQADTFETIEALLKEVEV
jgi:endo-1,4-beta-D-glucanase Y